MLVLTKLFITKVADVTPQLGCVMVTSGWSGAFGNEPIFAGSAKDSHKVTLYRTFT